MQSFDFVVAVNTLVDAWEGVKPELIQTCFHTAGFMTYVPPPPEPLPEPPRNLWERMQNICRAMTRPPHPSSTAECLCLIAHLRGEQASAASWELRPLFEAAEID